MNKIDHMSMIMYFHKCINIFLMIVCCIDLVSIVSKYIYTSYITWISYRDSIRLLMLLAFSHLLYEQVDLTRISLL